MNGSQSHPRNQRPLDDLSSLAIALLSICRRSGLVGVRAGSPLAGAAVELAGAGYVRLRGRCACCGLVAVEGK